MIALALLPAAFGSQWRVIPSLDQSIPIARAVVVGTVVAAEPSPAPWGLSTRYQIQIDEVLSGYSEPLEVIELPGGRASGLIQRFSGIPVWSIGDTVVVLLPVMGTGPPLSGVFTVIDDALVDPIAGIGERGRPDPVWTLHELRQRIDARPLEPPAELSRSSD